VGLTPILVDFERVGEEEVEGTVLILAPLSGKELS